MLKNLIEQKAIFAVVCAFTELGDDWFLLKLNKRRLDTKTFDIDSKERAEFRHLYTEGKFRRVLVNDNGAVYEYVEAPFKMCYNALIFNQEYCG